MATISENYLSRPFTVGLFHAGRELVYDIQGTEDEEEVEALLVATAPAAYLGRVLDTISAEPLGGGIWKGYARYVRLEADSEFTFDTTGGSTKITQAISTINAYALGGGTPPDFDGAIGVSEDRVEGVEVVTPTLNFTETHVFAAGAVDTAYILALRDLTGRVNDATFRGMAAGEVLFRGATGGKRPDGQYAITFRFITSQNRTGLSVGSITGISKGGWEYLWVRYADYPDTTAFALVKRPIAVYVEQVYYPGDFDALGIG